MLLTTSLKLLYDYMSHMFAQDRPTVGQHWFTRTSPAHFPIQLCITSHQVALLDVTF